MNHSEISVWDLVIIAVYLITMISIGVYSIKRVKNRGDYYVAGRSFGPMVLMATVCATIIGGSGLMGRAGVAYSSGFKAIITAVPYLLGMLIFSWIAGRISDMGTVASQVTATATIVKMLGGQIGLSYEIGALIACVVFMLYTATSGLYGVVYTDVLQFYILILFVYILIPVASLLNIGGFSNFTANLDPGLVQPYVNGSILGDIVTYLVFTMAGAEMWQRAFAAKDRKSAKKGMFLGTAVYGVTIFLVFFMGIIAHQIIGDDVLAQYGSTDAVIPALAIKVLPIGLTGIALAGMLSVIMSTADSYLLVSVQTCVSDIGKTISPGMSEKTELRLSRIFAVILPIGALVIALYIKNAYATLMFAWCFYAAAAGIPAFAALFWKKATKQGIIVAMVSGFTVCIAWKLLGQPFGLGAAVPGTIACAIALVTVSLATFQKHPAPFLSASEDVPAAE